MGASDPYPKPLRASGTPKKFGDAFRSLLQVSRAPTALRKQAPRGEWTTSSRQSQGISLRAFWLRLCRGFVSQLVTLLPGSSSSLKGDSIQRVWDPDLEVFIARIPGLKAWQLAHPATCVIKTHTILPPCGGMG